MKSKVTLRRKKSMVKRRTRKFNKRTLRKKIGFFSRHRYPQSNEFTRDKIKTHRPDAAQLTCSELLDKIIEALEEKKPLSVVSVGQTESFIMSQYTLYSHREILRDPETLKANEGVTTGLQHRGIRLPNKLARVEAVEAVRQADIVGYNTIIPSGALAEKVFEVHNIKPKYVFEAFLRRVMMYSQKEKFESMLGGRKILLISSIADQVKDSMDKNLKPKLGFDVVGSISINSFEEIPMVKEKVADYDFDLCLIAAGINAVILAPFIAQTYQKVAIDMGGGLSSLATGEMLACKWMTKRIGLDKLMGM
ncbi:GT-D fold domain-containing glycosyltransferase [Brevibacillus sp. H7]|uniref:GT-D fold domain-containing glycosyltransferase n=1 Tax=Brevibacillus sp. H7 TaxID=3349138 RepID=UPI0037F767C5